MKNSHRPPDLQDPTLLFEEYLRARDEGRSVDMAQLCARAGPRESDLKKRIDIFRTLQELSDTLDGEPEGGTPATANIQRLGRFESLVCIGRGGLSQVFLGHDPTLKRNVALKILAPDQIATSDARSWIASEAQSLARLDHPGVVRVFEIGEADGFAFIAMEFVAGPSLAAVLERLRSGAAGDDAAVEAAALRLTSVDARCRLVLELARALAYCHERGVVHRDIKPGNVILQANGQPKLIDFGLAHLESDAASLTQVTQRLMGTPAYIAPEQVDGGRTGASPLSDQFSVGVVLYELLTSKNAFVRPSRSATLDAISRAEAPPPRTLDPSIPVDLERICLHALERSPHARYASMAILADDLDAFLDHRPISLRAPTPIKTGLLWARRHRREIALSAKALTCALAVALAFWIGGAMRERWRFKADMARLGASTNGLDTPEEFSGWYESFRVYEADAKRLDRELAAHVLGADMSPIAASQVARTSERLADVLGNEWEVLERSRPNEPAKAAALLMGQWRDPLASDAVYCPGCTSNARDRARGEVDLPTPGPEAQPRLWQYGDGPSPITPNLRLVDPAQHLAAGVYRLRWVDALHRVVLDTEFLVRPEQERWKLEVAPLHTAIDQRMIEIEPTTVDVAGAGQIEVAAFRIMRDVVSWRELLLGGWSIERINGAKTLIESATKVELDLDSPACLTWEESFAFATAVGARLPSGSELAALLWNDQHEPPGHDSTIAGEMVSSFIKNGEVGALLYRTTVVGKQIVPVTRLYATDGMAVHPAESGALRIVTFRLACSASE